MEHPKTVKVKHPQVGVLIINESDYDPKVHGDKLPDDAEAPPAQPAAPEAKKDRPAGASLTVPQLKEALAEAGVEFDPDAKKADLVKLYDEQEG